MPKDCSILLNYRMEVAVPEAGSQVEMAQKVREVAGEPTKSPRRSIAPPLPPSSKSTAE